MTSICGLGQVALGPVMSVLRRQRTPARQAEPPDGCHRPRILHGQDRGPGAGRVPPAPPHRRRDGRRCRGRRPASRRRTIHAQDALPGFDRSSVDGYAVRAAGHVRRDGRDPRLPTSPARSRWARPPTRPSAPRPRSRSRPAACCPTGADAVVMIEHTQEAMPGTIEVARPGRARRRDRPRRRGPRAGGRRSSAPERPLRAQDVAMLAACGVVRARRPRPPRGRDHRHRRRDRRARDRAARAGSRARRAERLGRRARAARRAATRVHHAIVPDDRGALRTRCAAAGAATSSSSAPARRSAVATRPPLRSPRCRSAEIWCHGLAIKPGKPTLLAHSDGIPIIGLPGNPRSALVVFRLIGMPLVRRVGGWTVEHRDAPRPRPLARDLPSAAGRLDVVQVRL